MSEQIENVGWPSDRREESHFNRIRRTINVYRAALDGQVDIHHWVGKHGEIMKWQVTPLDMPVEQTPEGMTPELAASLGVQYAGVMTSELLQQRIDELTKGNGDAGGGVPSSHTPPTYAEDLSMYRAAGFISQAWDYDGQGKVINPPLA